MSESSMVCNGHKENNVEKCTANAVSELYSAFEKSSANTTNIAENPANKSDTMTIGTIPFPDFDHLYASSVEETADSNTMSLNIARSNLNSYHLNIIEEQAKIIDVQSQEISKLKKQNESLIARIERMNRRLNLNQCNRRSLTRRNHSGQSNASDSEPAESTEPLNSNEENTKDDHFDDTFPDDVPLIKLATGAKQNDELDTKSISEEPLTDGLEDPILKQEENEPITDQASNSKILVLSKESGGKSNFRIKFRRNNITSSSERRKRSKMVRFAEENKNCLQNLEIKSPKRNCAKTVDEQLITDDAVLFLKTQTEQESDNKPVEENVDEAQAAQIKKRKSLRIPILVTHEPYFTTVREDICHDPVTYTPTCLEVPSFRTIEKDNVEPPDVPKDYFEDVRIEAAKERHLRFEIGERKRKKWDVQRIRELRQNERLKEKLRRRKSRWNKMDSPKQMKNQTPEQIITLFPDIKSIEKIIITDAVPVTALGTSIPRVPSWGVDFQTDWVNDGSIDSITYEESLPAHVHHKDNKSKPA